MALRQKFSRRIILIILSIIVTIFVLFPFAWMASYSLRPRNQIFETPPKIIPNTFVFDNFRAIMANNRFGLFFRNSLIVSLCSTLFIIVVACMAGYSLSRFAFKGKNVLTYSILGSQLFPVYVILLPLFIIYNTLQLYDTLIGLIIVYVAIAQPFSILLMIGFFKEIPIEMEESAYIDGATKLQTFVRIVLPNALNGITAMAIFTLIVTWQEMLLALSLTVSEESRTLTVGLMYFFGQYQTDYAGLMAASVVITIPTLVIFLILQKFFIKGMMSGTVKG